MEIRVGAGNVHAGCITDKSGTPGLLIRKSNQSHPINSKDPNWVPGTKYHIKKTDVVIWCDNLESIRVLQDAINTIALRTNGRIAEGAP